MNFTAVDAAGVHWPVALRLGESSVEFMGHGAGSER